MKEACRNYAIALYEMLGQQERQRALEAFSSLLQDLKNEPSFEKMLRSYSLSLDEKKAAIDKVYGAKYPDLQHFVSFLKVLIDHHRIKDLPQIYAEYRSMVFGDIGVLEGYAYSAERLSDEQLSSISDAIGKRIGSKVSLTNIVDHRLLGGVKVSVDGKVFDGTLASKLEGLRRELKGGI